MIEIEREYGEYKRSRIDGERLYNLPNDIRFGTSGIGFMFHKLANPINGAQGEGLAYSEAAAMRSDGREDKKN